MAVETVTRKLTAILYADVAEYSRLTGDDEVGTHKQLSAGLDLISERIEDAGGRVVHYAGDAVLAEFASVVAAVETAVGIQRQLEQDSAEVSTGKRLQFRIGINLGEVIVDRDDIYGDGVNIAARLEGLAEPGGICISGRVYQQVEGKLDFGYEYLGEQEVKNIRKPVRVFRVKIDDGGARRKGVRPAVVNTDGPLALPDKPSIAVLPFDNMSGDPEQEFFADGMAEEIITALSHYRWFFVIARNSSFTYKGRAVDVKQVAQELGVRYVLEGSVRKAGNRVRVTAQLIDASTCNHIWAEHYDRELDDIFALQDEITESVVTSIEPELMKAEIQRTEQARPQNMDAWAYAIQAMSYLWRLSGQDSSEAQALLRKALDSDPEYAHAYSLLAWAYIFHAWMGWGDKPTELIPLARQMARTALELDEYDPWAHLALGMVYAYSRDNEQGVAEIERALELNPNFSVARGFLGVILGYGAKPSAAMSELNKAVRASPRDPFNALYPAFYAVAHFAADRLREAAECAREAVRLRPSHVGPYRMLAVSCSHLGELEEAGAALQQAKRLQPKISLAWAQEFSPWARPEELARYVDGLRKAGLSE
jgi:adenylate cyclase